MGKFLVVLFVVLLLAGFGASTYAAYNGYGLVASGGGSSTRSIGVPIFVGGGPGSGK